MVFTSHFVMHVDTDVFLDTGVQYMDGVVVGVWMPHSKKLLASSVLCGGCMFFLSLRQFKTPTGAILSVSVFAL